MRGRRPNAITTARPRRGCMICARTAGSAGGSCVTPGTVSKGWAPGHVLRVPLAAISLARPGPKRSDWVRRRDVATPSTGGP